MTGEALQALDAPVVARISRLSALETARARIALAVELGLLAPGTALPAEKRLADAFRVSDMTVRRAMESLADEGVLVRRRGRTGGTFVADRPARSSSAATGAFHADGATVHALIDQRAVVEAGLAHHAALAATAAQLDRLESLVERAGEAKDWPDYHSIDREFHLEAARASGQEWALAHYRDVLDRLYAYFLPYPIDHLHEVNHNEHGRFVSALRDRDPVRAVAEIQGHVRRLHESMYVGLAPGGAAAILGDPDPVASATDS